MRIAADGGVDYAAATPTATTSQTPLRAASGPHVSPARTAGASPDTIDVNAKRTDPTLLGGWLDTNPLNLGSSALKGPAVDNPTRWFPHGPLPPNSSLTDGNGYRYTSDMFGRPVTASGDLVRNPNPSTTRDAAARAAQRVAGGADRLATDQGGHGIGNQFFGRNDAWNLTPQDDNLNHSAYRAMENSWSRTLRQPGGGSVHADVRAVYDRPTLRPTDYVSTYSQSGGPTRLRVMENSPNAGFTDTLGNIGKDEAFLNGLGKVGKGLDTFGKVAAPVAAVADGVRLYGAFQQDGGTIGKHTLETSGSVAGGWAGAAVGAETGAEAGAAVGALFGGVGAAPGALVGGVVGGVVGGLAGSQLGEDAVKVGEKAVGALGDAGRNVLGFLGL